LHGGRDGDDGQHDFLLPAPEQVGERYAVFHLDVGPARGNLLARGGGVELRMNGSMGSMSVMPMSTA